MIGSCIFKQKKTLSEIVWTRRFAGVCAQKPNWSKHARREALSGRHYYKTRKGNRTERLRNVAEETSIWPEATRLERELTRIGRKKAQLRAPWRIQYWSVLRAKKWKKRNETALCKRTRDENNRDHIARANENIIVGFLFDHSRTQNQPLLPSLLLQMPLLLLKETSCAHTLFRAVCMFTGKWYRKFMNNVNNVLFKVVKNFLQQFFL